MKHIIVSFAALAFLFACEKPAEEVKDKLDENTQALAGTWKVLSATHTHEIYENNVWKSVEDTAYPDAAGTLFINYLEERNFNGNYTFTFDSLTDAHTFEGSYSATPLEAISIKSGSNHILFEAGVFVDFVLTKPNTNEIKINRKIHAPNSYKKDWVLHLRKQ